MVTTSIDLFLDQHFIFDLSQETLVFALRVSLVLALPKCPLIWLALILSMFNPSLDRARSEQDWASLVAHFGDFPRPHDKVGFKSEYLWDQICPLNSN